MSGPSPITVYRFYKDIRPSKDGAGFEEIDMVEYGPVGNPGCRTNAKTSTLSKVIDAPPNTNPAADLARMRWDFIRPSYEAWLSGQEIPLDGTPLAHWNGVTAEQADILKTKGFKTVESIAAMTDSHRERVPLMGMRTMCESAKRFLAAADAAKGAAEIAKREEEAAALKAQLADQHGLMDEMAQQIADMKAEMRQRAVEAVETAGDDAAPKRKPGRPSNAERAQAAA